MSHANLDLTARVVRLLDRAVKDSGKPVSEIARLAEMNGAMRDTSFDPKSAKETLDLIEAERDTIPDENTDIKWHKLMWQKGAKALTALLLKKTGQALQLQLKKIN